MNEISVFAPATVANVGCGFDILGLCLENIGDEMTVSRNDSGKVTISRIEGAEGIPYEAEKNVAGAAVLAMILALDNDSGFDIQITKKVKPGSGLGSSASSSAGAVYAVNKLMGDPFSPVELVRFAMEGEKVASKKAHADNVAPSLYGGFVLIRSYDPLDIIEIPYPDDLYVVVAYPQVEVKTSDAAQMLKKQVKMNDAITQWGNVAGLVAGLMKGDYPLIGRSMQDVIVEPIRSILIPCYEEAKIAALDAGALGFNISGSGPSVFAFCQSKGTAAEVKAAIEKVYQNEGVDTLFYTSGINKKGTEVINKQASF
ncbi:MAG: homoserine kinase [Bacteroidota bacterium]